MTLYPRNAQKSQFLIRVAVCAVGDLRIGPIFSSSMLLAQVSTVPPSDVGIHILWLLIFQCPEVPHIVIVVLEFKTNLYGSHKGFGHYTAISESGQNIEFSTVQQLPKPIIL
jgi:hypothetical protein